MKSIRLFLASLVMFVTIAALPTGCATKLQDGGAYAAVGTAPDKAFYGIDASFDLGYSILDAAFNFERNNRAYLWSLSPDIKHTLDHIRPQATEVVATYGKARKAYMANPTPSGLTDLQTALGRMQQLSSAAQAVIPKQ